jgi:hypothetical protein
MDWEKLASEVGAARASGRALRARSSTESTRGFPARRAHRRARCSEGRGDARRRADEELDALARARVAAVDPEVPLVLQPVTPRGAVKKSPEPAQLIAWQARLERTLRDVRVIPQTHPGLGVR